jgi:uncharacterized membrane protein YgdD (TMEM256/DUF423 family)
MSEVNKTNELNAIRFTIICGAIFALLSVAIGAFAAHGLKAQLSDYQLGIVETGAKYQMYHGFALILSGLCCAVYKQIRLRLISACFIAGTLCFSGSLYVLALFELRFVVFITPVGGVLFLLGWATLVYQFLKIKHFPNANAPLKNASQIQSERKDAS